MGQQSCLLANDFLSRLVILWVESQNRTYTFIADRDALDLRTSRILLSRWCWRRWVSFIFILIIWWYPCNLTLCQNIKNKAL